MFACSLDPVGRKPDGELDEVRKRTIRVRSREGEVVEWSNVAAKRANTLQNWMQELGDEEGCFETPSMLHLLTLSARSHK